MNRMAHPNTAAGSRVATVPGYRPRGAWRELLWRLGLIGVLCVSQIAGAQARFRPRAEEPEWFKWRITEVDAGAYAEGTYEEGRFGNDSRSTYERFFIGPLVGASVAGSVYHPNLFQFSASGEGSYGWVEQSVHSGGQTTHTEEWDYLGNFSGTANILANKPYNGTLFGSYGRSFREYDFFNRVEISAWNYGAHLGYTRPGLTVTMTYAHHDEDTDNLTGFHETVTVTNVVNGTNVVVTTNHVQTFSQPSTVHQDVVTFNALNDRKTGSSTFNYNFSQ